MAKHADYEWGLTEYKINGRVFSRIVSSADPLNAGGIAGTELNKGNVANLAYWVSIHNHPRGGNGLSSEVNPGDLDDRTTRINIRDKYPDAEMEAFDHSHIKQGRRFIEKYRK